MKKIISIFFIGICIIFLGAITQTTYAASASISASKTTVKKNEKVTISANISSAASWALNVSATGGSLSKSDNRVGTTESGKNESKKITLGTFNASSIGEYTIKLSGYVVDGNVLTKSNVGGSIKIKVVEESNSTTTKPTSTSTNTKTPTKSKVTTLQNLGIKDNDFSGFNPTKKEYKKTVPYEVSSVNVYAVKGQSGQKISGTGNKNLKVGNNTLNVVVTAENGKDKRTYTINIERLAEKQEEKPEEKTEEIKVEEVIAQTGLLSLNIEDAQILEEFKQDVYKYNVNLAKDIEKLDIKTTTSENCEVEIVGNKNLEKGKNIIVILVTELDSDKTTTYQLIVNKQVGKEKKNNVINGICAVIAVLIISMLIYIKGKIRRRE